MTDRRLRWLLLLLFSAWLVGLGPFLAWALPLGRAGVAGEYGFLAALLLYFAAPFLILARLA